MGQFEKIVVLLIGFFLVTVIIAVTFGPSEDKPFSMGPSDEFGADEGAGQGLDSADPPPATEDLAARDPEPEEGPNPRRESVPGGGPRNPGAEGGAVEEGAAEERAPQDRGLLALREEERRNGEGTRPNLLLETAGQNTTGGSDRALPEGAALITLDGLTNTFAEDIKEYTWQRNDTFVDVARKLYGDGERSRLLRQFNEGRTYVAPGDRILVPVFDGRAASSSSSVLEENTSGEEPPSVARGNLYTVVDGDSLWVISKKVYGKGAQWEKIYEANRDQLPGPDDLKIGMELRVP